jgi:PmbA protein
VILDPWMGQALLGSIGPLFSAENVLKGKSLFADRVGRMVASEAVTIVDDPRMRGGLRSAPFDGEGVATERRTLVERGELRTYLHSLRTATRMAGGHPGNARRGSYTSPAQIAPANLHVAPGSEPADAAIERSGRALRVTSLLNLHTIDPISGEFSLGASGELLERGELLYPVQGVTIAGNLTQLLMGVVAVGNDLVFGPNGIGCPTLVISELSIGGTS